MSEIAAAIKNVSFQYQNVNDNALNNIDLTIFKGECVLLCGDSGSGKTSVTRLLNGLLDRSIFNLSGGEKQKISCADAAAMQPDIFVLDEPPSNLDIDSIEQLKGILRL